ncbi:MAG: MarR family transcriptional regulator [Bacteroidetes bacterium]|nr:MarR family transcriptional regulator [Bacteroidota bacterium]
MEIGKEIKQKKFVSSIQKVVLNIIYTAAALNVDNTRFLKPYGISPQQYNILRILKGQDPNPTSVNTLIDRMLDKSSNASRLVEKLRQKDLVERHECPGDRRQVDIGITKKGLKLLDGITIEKDQNMGKWNNLSDKEAQQLSNLLDKLRA